MKPRTGCIALPWLAGLPARLIVRTDYARVPVVEKPSAPAAAS